MTFQATTFALLCLTVFSQSLPAQTRQHSIPQTTLLRIVKAEDERRWDGDLRSLLTSSSSVVRSRAALAAGRIGNEGALAELSSMLQQDKDSAVRAMAAFAIGEIESLNGASPLLTSLKSSTETDEVKARAIEGLGKIAAALPPTQQARTKEIGAEVLAVLKSELAQSSPNRQILLLGTTAVLRSKPAEVG